MTTSHTTELGGKYGTLPQKRAMLSGRKPSQHFDSADWALSLAGASKDGPAELAHGNLPPRHWQPPVMKSASRRSPLGLAS